MWHVTEAPLLRQLLDSYVIALPVRERFQALGHLYISLAICPVQTTSITSVLGPLPPCVIKMPGLKRSVSPPPLQKATGTASGQ